MAIRRAKRPSEQTRIRAKELRLNTSVPEKLLWSALRGKKAAGLKFRRQHPIEPYIADFYCPAARLVIEVDGESHDDTIEHDAIRTEYLSELNLDVIRVSNDDVLNNLEGVVDYIVKVALQRVTSPFVRPLP